MFSLIIGLVLATNYSMTGLIPVRYLVMADRKSTKINLTLSSFNCKGINSSLPYVLSLRNNHNMNFICEHWLHPGELPATRKVLSDAGKWFQLKSSINPTVDRKERPLGGRGFICDAENFGYRIIDCPSDRVRCIQLSKHETTLVTIIGVYLPYSDNTGAQVELYMDTISIIQSIIDDHSNSGSQVLVTGDMNTSLPHMDILTPNWYKNRPFNENIAILYSFIEDNDFCVANMIFKQNINFTCENGSSHSYIDHILVPDFCRELIMNCTILNGDAANVSDHLALSLSMQFPQLWSPKMLNVRQCLPSLTLKRKPNMCDVQFQRRFSEQLDQNLCNVSLICI